MNVTHQTVKEALAGVRVVAWLHDHGSFSWPDQRNVDRSNAKRMVLLEDVRAALASAAPAASSLGAPAQQLVDRLGRMKCKAGEVSRHCYVVPWDDLKIALTPNQGSGEGA